MYATIACKWPVKGNFMENVYWILLSISTLKDRARKALFSSVPLSYAHWCLEHDTEAVL